MKLNTVRSLFEFRDNTFEGVYDNLISSAGQMQGLGLPDVCIISKRQPMGMFKSGYDLQSTFHCVQGICPTSQAEVSAYIQQLYMNQERDPASKIFVSDVIIYKITYVTYDIFTKTLIVCQFEQPNDGLSQFKSFGIQSNKQCIQLTKGHWEGAHISGVLRVIDNEFKIPSIGRFYNQTSINNPKTLNEFITKLLNKIQGLDNYFQDLNKIKSKSDFPDINDIIYYLNWPLHILCKYLDQTGQLDVLLEQFQKLDDNLIFKLIKSLIHYKMKNYNHCLKELGRLAYSSHLFNLPKYIMAHCLFKMNQLEKTFTILKDLIVECYETQNVWILLSKVFRKARIYQISVVFVNRAASMQAQQTVTQIWNDVQVLNYRLMTQNKNLQSPTQLDQIYKIVHPLVAEKIESYVQLCGYPQVQNLLVRPRQNNKKEQKLELMQRAYNKPDCRISPTTYDTLMNNELLEIEEESPNLLREIIKISSSIGYQKLKNYLNQYFYNNGKTQIKQIDQIYDPSEFQIVILNKNTLNINVGQCSNTNVYKQLNQKSMCNPKLSDDIDDCDSDEEQPEFLKRKRVNKSFDFANIGTKLYQTPQHSKIPRSPLKFTSIRKAAKPQIKKANTIIIENAFESVESDRQNKQFVSLVNRVTFTQQNEMISQAPKSGQDVQPQKIFIYSLMAFLNPNIGQSEQVQMNEQLKRRKEQLNSVLFGIVETIVKAQIELDNLFYPSSSEKQQPSSVVQSSIQTIVTSSPKAAANPLFKSNLKKALQNKQHLDKQIELKEFYLVQQLDEDTDKEKTYISLVKAESMFLYKCARLATLFRRNDLAYQILQRINTRIISVQISALFFKVVKDNNKQLIRQIQRMLSDFQECGISIVGFVPLWIENKIVKMTKLNGANQILGLLSSSETDYTFYLIKKIILSTDNLM